MALSYRYRRERNWSLGHRRLGRAAADDRKRTFDLARETRLPDMREKIAPCRRRGMNDAAALGPCRKSHVCFGPIAGIRKIDRPKQNDRLAAVSPKLRSVF
jgi:hypothetical protein